jgi:hypothetical protein
MNTVIGQEIYPIVGLIDVETATFNIGDARFYLERVARQEYFGYPRVDNVPSLPYRYHLERNLGGSNFYLYYVPSQVWPVKIWGKFMLTDVTLDQDLLLTLDKFYIEYLRFSLAKRICTEYGVTFQPQSAEELKRLESLAVDISPIDYSMKKSSTLQGTPYDSGDIYLSANFGIWRP